MGELIGSFEAVVTLNGPRRSLRANRYITVHEHICICAFSSLCSVERSRVTVIKPHTVCDILFLICLYCLHRLNKCCIIIYVTFFKWQFVSVVWHDFITIKIRCILFSHNWPLNKLRKANNAWSVKSSHCLVYEGGQWYQHNTRVIIIFFSL